MCMEQIAVMSDEVLRAWPLAGQQLASSFTLCATVLIPVVCLADQTPIWVKWVV